MHTDNFHKINSSNKLFTIATLVFIFFFIVNECVSQEKSFVELQQLSFNIEKHFNDTINTQDWDWVAENFPVVLGLEVGTSLSRGHAYVSTDFIASLDINLYERTTFFRFEIGRLYYNNSRKFTYASLGVNFKIFKPGKSRFFLYTGVGFGLGNHGIYGSLEASARYVYIINKFFGISTSIKYPFWAFEYSDKGDPLISVGVQFFTK